MHVIHLIFVCLITKATWDDKQLLSWKIKKPPFDKNYGKHIMRCELEKEMEDAMEIIATPKQSTSSELGQAIQISRLQNGI